MRRLSTFALWTIVLLVILQGTGILPVFRIIAAIAQGQRFLQSTNCAAAGAMPTGSVCIQYGVPPGFWFHDGVAWAQYGYINTTGSTVTLNSASGANSFAYVALAGQQTAILTIPASVGLTGSTIKPVIWNTTGAPGATDYILTDHLGQPAAHFVDGNGNETFQLDFPLDTPTNPITLRIVTYLAGSHVGVKVITYGSSSAAATLRAVAFNALTPIAGIGGKQTGTGVTMPSVEVLAGGRNALLTYDPTVKAIYGYPRPATGTLNAANAVVGPIVGGGGSVCFEILSGASGLTIIPEARYGSGTYIDQSLAVAYTSGSAASFPARACFYHTGFNEYQVRASAWSSGSSPGTIQVNHGPNLTRTWTLSSPPPYDGTNTAKLDPCETETKITKEVSQTASTVHIPAVAGKKTYICSAAFVAAAAEVINLVEGTVTVCGTGTAALAGSTTVANGMSFSANGGLIGVGGKGTTIVGKSVNVDVCLTQSGSNRVSGFITYVQRVP